MIVCFKVIFLITVFFLFLLCVFYLLVNKDDHESRRVLVHLTFRRRLVTTTINKE